MVYDVHDAAARLLDRPLKPPRPTRRFQKMTALPDSQSKKTLIQRIHNSPLRLVIASAGGGSRAISDLLSVPGASKTMLEAVVPYSAAAQDAFLGGAPDQYCSQATARAMAMVAFQRARDWDKDENPLTLLGVGCTASLASDRPKRGAHRLHVAVQTATSTRVASLQLNKEARSREEEESLCAAIILNQIASAYEGMTGETIGNLNLDLLPGEEILSDSAEARASWAQLLLNETGRAASSSRSNMPERVVFPGSFNPMHDGHRKMIDIASEMLKEPVALEISITNVDKPPLDFLEIRRRLQQIGDYPVWLTDAPTFLDKTWVFQDVTFIVGADTILRIADPAYYENNRDYLRDAIAEFAASGCRFLVFGRMIGGRFTTLDDLKLPRDLRELCVGVPESAFREDLSSTELRTDADDVRNPAS